MATLVQVPAAPSEIEHGADRMLGQLAREEKIDLLGVHDFYVRAMPKIGLPRLQMGLWHVNPQSTFHSRPTPNASATRLM
jgi:hypothetical protein